ncbi:MAG TPA: exopolysaccharide biosynthesis polyprenyl glycosylphosphotransferase [Terriglobia bacterium]|nr:exopolysaccharide biosynthesis polyprenyl glycosylphosphotransferase [Terriglobia bacterium]
MTHALRGRATTGVIAAIDIAALSFSTLITLALWSGKANAISASSAINLLIIAILTILCLSGIDGSAKAAPRASAFIVLPFLRNCLAIVVAWSILAATDYIAGPASIPLAAALPFAVAWLAAAGAATLCSRSACWYLLEAAGASAKHRIAIVGAGPLGTKLARMIEERFGEQISIVGIYDDRATRIPEAVCGLSVEPVEKLHGQVRQNRVDKILVALPLNAEERLLDVLIRLKSLPVDVSILPDGLGIRLFGQQASTSADGFNQLFLNIFHRPMSASDQAVKRAFDVIVSLMLLVFLAPVMAITGLAIVLTSPGPVFFRQPRAGLYDDVIRVFKFRTMYAHRTDLLASQQTQRNDPRITAVGRFLRKTSIDELPQLFNVLMGEMSLVGPRPHATGMCINGQPCHKIFREYAHRHRVKPGVTGWAQVNGFRGAVEDAAILNERIKHDVYYIDNWSLWLDMEILLKTIPEIMFSKTAY